MWHEEDGEEGEGSGPLPDPETRHWRHPSELGRAHALPHPDPTPLPDRPLAGSLSTRWPAVAVGGCLALAVVGVVGLQNRQTGTSTIGTDTAGTALTTPSSGPFERLITLAIERDDDELSPAEPTIDELAGPDRADGNRPNGDRPNEDRGNEEAGPTPSAPPTTIGRPEVDGTIARPAAGLTSISTSLSGAEDVSQAEIAPVYGVYRSPTEDGRLGSFLVVDGEVVTSASALDGRTAVLVRVAADWVGATVVATDPLTDVALLDLGGELPADLPVIELATEAIDLDDPVMVGYGDPTAPAPSDPDEETDEIDDLDEIEEIDDDVWLQASDRRGWVYSTTGPLLTPSNRVVHDPILVMVDPHPGDAGAPLRSQDGRVIGLTILGDGSQLAAVPIDRVIEAVHSLRSGAEASAWLGIEVDADPDGRGLVVAKVDEASPVRYLRAGDVIVAADGQPTNHADDLRYAARTAGVGGHLELTFQRGGVRVTIDVAVGASPNSR